MIQAKKLSRFGALVLGFAVLQGFSFAQTTLINPVVEQKVDSLMKLMTLAEKIGQMTQHNGSWDVTGPVPEGNDYAQQRYELMKKGGVGSMLNIIGAEATRDAQRIAVDETRLGIPLIFGYDVVHGYKTIFPIPLGEAASWDLKAVEKSARVAAIEAAAAGLQWTFAPMVDVGRDARWGRVMEGSGEDPYLGSKMAVARVIGFQGDDLSANNTIIATAKHFAAYAFAEAGRDYNTAEISRNTLLNMVMPPFKAASDAGVATFMNSFNDINGIPATANSYLQRDVLKGDWDFKGFVVSDWGSIREMIIHGYSKDLRTAGFQAIEAGSDMDMESDAYSQYLLEMVENDEVDEALIDDAARRILRMKFLLGLFDDPYKYSDVDREAATLLSDEHRAISRDVAKRSIVLLKNEGNLLPIAKKGTIGVIGALAADKDSPIGSWRGQGEANSAVSLLEGLKNAVGNKAKIEYAQGYTLASADKSFAAELTFPEDDGSGFAKAVALAKKSDVVVMAVGEDAFQTGEGRSQADISLKGRQLELLQKVMEVNDNVVVVLMAGRPIIEEWMYENAPAILNTWHLGTEAGNAIADVVFGAYNPSGKLPISIPHHVGQVPLYYNRKATGRIGTGVGDNNSVFWSHYTDAPNDARYAFGYGLSYSNFEYSKFKLSANKMALSETITVTVEVKNTSKVDGEEVVQLYIKDHFASAIRPIKELKGFEKVMIKAGETKTITFDIDWETLAFYAADEVFKAEPGMFTIMVGGNSVELLSADLELTK